MKNISIGTEHICATENGLVERIRKATEHGFYDAISIGYGCEGPYNVLLLIFDKKFAEAITAEAKGWKKWKKADDDLVNFWRKNISEFVEIFEVESEFREIKIDDIEGFEVFFCHSSRSASI